MTNQIQNKTSGTSWKDMVYIGIALLGFFAIKKATPSQSGYQQVSLDSWKPMAHKEKLKLGIYTK